jgi:hypothetical protein
VVFHQIQVGLTVGGSQDGMVLATVIPGERNMWRLFFPNATSSSIASSGWFP